MLILKCYIITLLNSSHKIANSSFTAVKSTYSGKRTVESAVEFIISWTEEREDCLFLSLGSYCPDINETYFSRRGKSHYRKVFSRDVESYTNET